MADKARILIIDDLVSIHDDFAKILCPRSSSASKKLDEMNEVLFGKKKNIQNLPEFELTFASQGQEGLDLVKHAQDLHKPFAVAFVDVQMPPGMDGIETIEQIWKIDSFIQVVICTAYAKYTWSDIQSRFGDTDRLFILKKPFDQIEILNLASTLTKKWKISRELNHQLSNQHLQPKEVENKLDLALKKMNENVAQLKLLDEKLKEQKRKATR